MRAFFHASPLLTATPTTPLPALAAELGLGALSAKDESARFGLNAFKLLGARFAIETLLAEGQLRAGATVVCASEGNHGRAVARAASDAGCASRVYMAHDVAQARVDAIAGEGAEVVRVDGSYDDAVRILQEDAAANGWTIVSDTAWPGYERIPFLIMLGYTRMMDEVRDRIRDQGAGSGIGEQGFDAVFVQGGVGGLLCAIASWCAFHWPQCKVIGVEPTQAACLQASARAGHAGDGRRPHGLDAGGTSQPRSVAARVRITSAECRCVHGNRRRLGARWRCAPWPCHCPAMRRSPPAHQDRPRSAG